MRIYVRTAPFPVVARAQKKGDGKRGRSCVKRSAILIVSSFSRWSPLFEEQRKNGAFLSSQSGKETRRSIDEYFTNAYFVRDVTKKLKERNCRTKLCVPIFNNAY